MTSPPLIALVPAVIAIVGCTDFTRDVESPRADDSISARDEAAAIASDNALRQLVGSPTSEPIGRGELTAEHQSLPGDVTPVGHRVLDAAFEPAAFAGDFVIREEWRIGGPNASGPAVFGASPLLVTLGPQREAYVLDGATQEIRVFDPEGEFIRAFGGRGGGPGEFEVATTLGWDSDGNLWVGEPIRYTVFDGEGRVVRTILREHSGSPNWRMSRSPDQSRDFVEAVTFTDVGGDMAQAHTGRVGISLSRIDYDGARIYSYPVTSGPRLDLRDNADAEPNPRTAARIVVGSVVPGRRLADLNKYVPRPIYNIVPGGIWIAASNENRIFYRSFEGDTLRVLELPLQPDELTAVQEREITSVVEANRRRREDFAYGRQLIRGLYPLPDGHLLALLEEGSGEVGRLLAVFDPSDRYLGVLRLTFSLDATSPPWLTDSSMIAVTQDELGVKYVIKASIERSAR